MPHSFTPSSDRSHGFSLLEVLITLAIVGLLLSVAVPSYQHHLHNARRAQAQATLMHLVSATEAHLTRHWRLEGFEPATHLPSPSPHYTFTFERTGHGYQWVGAPHAADRCGTLRLHHDGQQHPTTPGCWP